MGLCCLSLTFLPEIHFHIVFFNIIKVMIFADVLVKNDIHACVLLQRLKRKIICLQIALLTDDISW